MEKDQAPQTHHESHHHDEDSNTTLYYVIGAVVLVAVIAVGYFMRPKPQEATPAASQPVVQQPVATTAPKPITKIECDKQYYNTVVGKPQYFLSAEVSDLNGKGDISCSMTVASAGKTVAEETTTAVLTASPERGGVVGKCTTKPLELAKNVPTKVDVVATNASGETAKCTQTFLLP